MLSKQQIQDLIFKMAQQERQWLMTDSPRNAGMVPQVEQPPRPSMSAHEKARAVLLAALV